MSVIYQNLGTLATTAYVTSLGVGPQGNFVCDGTNEKAALEAAWTYVVAMGGGELVVGAGSFALGDATVYAQGGSVTVRGMGYPSYIHNLPTQDRSCISITGYDYVALKNLRLATTSAGHSADVVFIEDGADYFRLEGLWITDSDRYGVRIEGTSIVYGWIIGCYITGTDSDGIIINMDGGGDELHYAVIQGNLISSTGSGGINGTEMYRSLVQNNVLVSTGADGIYIQATRNVVNNNIIYDPSGHGVNLAWGNQSTVEGNVIYSPATDGVHTNNTDYTLISNNIVYDPADDGIEFDDSDYCTCEGNTIYSAGADGVYFAAGATQNSFTCLDNVVIDSTGNGLTVNNINHVKTSNNFSYNSGAEGLELSGSGLIAGNYSYSSGGNGVKLTGDGQQAYGNLVEGSTGDGIELNDSDNSHLIGNYLISNGAYGINLDNDSDNNLITGNFTRENTTACVNINAATCDNNRLWLNNFDEGNITDAGTGTAAFDNLDPSAKAWIASINAPVDGR